MQAFSAHDISWCRCLLTIPNWCIRQKKGNEGVSFFPFYKRKWYPLPSLWYHSLLGLQNVLLEHLLVYLWVFVWFICVISRPPHTFPDSCFRNGHACVISEQQRTKKVWRPAFLSCFCYYSLLYQNMLFLWCFPLCWGGTKPRLENYSKPCPGQEVLPFF